MKDIKMKIKTTVLLFVFSGGFIGLHANPVTAFLLAQSYQKQLNEQQKQGASSKNLKTLKRKKEKSPEHYVMVFQAMQKSVDLN